MGKAIRKYNLVDVVNIASGNSQQSEDEKLDRDINPFLNKENDRLLSGSKGRKTLRLVRSALKHLRQVGYGSDNQTFEEISSSMSGFLGTELKEEAIEVFVEHCEAVGGDFDSERDIKRFESFNDPNYSGLKRTPATILKRASDSGWTPSKSKQVIDHSLFVHFGLLEVKPPQWLVEDLFETDSLMVMYGPPASGKSFFALDMAFCIASGLDFHGKKVDSGSVFYIAGEGHNGLARRRKAWEQHNKTELASCPIYLTKSAISISDEIAASEVIESVRYLAEKSGVQPKLVVVDTLAKNFGGGDENATKDMNSFVAGLELIKAEFHCGVLVVHHTGKDQTRGARGNAALKAGVEHEYSVEKTGSKLILKCHKMKDAEEPKSMTFSMIQVTTADQNVSSVVLERLLDIPAPDRSKLGKHQKALLSLMEKNFEFTSEQLLNSAKLNRKQFKEAIQGLLERGIISMDSDKICVNTF